MNRIKKVFKAIVKLMDILHIGVFDGRRWR